MQKLDDNTKNAILNAGILLLMMVVFSGFLLYGREGYNVEIVRTQFIYYGFYGVGSVLAVLLFYFYSVSEDSPTNKYGTSIFFNSSGQYPSPELPFIRNTWRLIILSFMISVILALLATFSEQTYLGVGRLEQQFTETDNIMFNWLMVVGPENMGAMAFSSLGIVWLRKRANKWNMSQTSFQLLCLVMLVVTFMIFGLINHLLRYADLEKNLQQTLQFWMFLATITWLTGNALPGVIAHGTNNTYYEMYKIMKIPRDKMIIYTIGVEILLTVLFFITLYKKKQDINKPSGVLG